MNRSIASGALLAVSLLILCGADWKTRPFPDWDKDTVLRLVTDSPWAKARNVRLVWTGKNEQPLTYKDVPGADQTAQTPAGPVTGPGPLGGIGVPRSRLPDRADIIIRWASALPVRHAKALFRQRDKGGDPARASEAIEAPSADYVLEFFGLPVEAAHKGAGSLEIVAREGVKLQTKSGRILRPTKVEVQLQATTAALLVHFPRTEPIEVEDGDIECIADFQIFQVREKFKPSSMLYLGHLEL